MEESKSFTNCKKEARHNKTLECQKIKFERLWMNNKGGCSNQNSYMYGYHSSMYGYHSGKTLDSRPTATTKTAPSATSKWVINLSSKPLTTAQEQILTHRSNFAVTPRSPPIGEYIAAVKRTCQNMEQGEADEMRAEVKAVMKKSHPLDIT